MHDQEHLLFHGKTQVDDPTGSFWIILLGTDGLEKVFGQVHTMVRNDTHADQLQLTNLIDGAVQCMKILENQPEWGGQSRCLTVKPLSSNTEEISSAYDHISPKSWKGDVLVQNVVLAGCWSSGGREAEKYLRDAKLTPPFSEMEAKGGYNILCPFGNGKMMLVDGTLSSGEHEETDEETESYVAPTTTSSPGTTATTVANLSSTIANPPDVFQDNTQAGAAGLLHPAAEDNVEDLEPDFDDVVGLTKESSFENVNI